MKSILPLLVLLVFASGCMGPTDLGRDVMPSPYDDAVRAESLCRTLCESSDLDLDASPCLSNEIIEDWVCDVAHSPREDIDDRPENQCEAYRNGTAHHFVELDPDCNFIGTR